MPTNTILIRIDTETGVAYDNNGKPCGRWVPDELTLEMDYTGSVQVVSETDFRRRYIKA